MTKTPTSPLPIQKDKLRFRDWQWLIPYSIRGIGELARARIELGTIDTREIATYGESKGLSTGPINSLPMLLRIQFVIPRLAKKLPWRTDCLVQAIAARKWIHSSGLETQLNLGVKNRPGEQFGAHAWLICNGLIITGGDVDEYTVLTHKKARH